MLFAKRPQCGVFGEEQVAVLTAAFEEALRLTEIEDRQSLRAEALADRILSSFEVGERDPKRIARMAAEN
jgi:hypothetical protein